MAAQQARVFDAGDGLSDHRRHLSSIAGGDQ
jgi:hypothetical protein